MADHIDAPRSFTKDAVFRSKYMNEALNQGLKFGSNQFRVYHQLRWFEEEGDYKWSVASYKTLAEYVNLPEKEVRVALDKLRVQGIVQHIVTDKKWYRSKTDLWATTVALKERGIQYESLKVLSKGKRPEELMVIEKTSPGGEEFEKPSLLGEESSPAGEAVTPVFTEVGNNNINKNINIVSAYANLDSDESKLASAGFALDESYSSADADSSNSSNVEEFTNGSNFIKEKKEEMSFPFDESVLGDSREQEWHSASVKPQKKNSKNSQGWAVANEVYKKLGIGVKPSTKFVALVKHQIERGYTSEQILKCLDWCKTNDFYKDINDPMALLCDNAMDQANMKKQNKYGFKDEGGGVSTTDDIVY